MITAKEARELADKTVGDVLKIIAFVEQGILSRAKQGMYKSTQIVCCSDAEAAAVEKYLEELGYHTNCHEVHRTAEDGEVICTGNVAVYIYWNLPTEDEL